MKLKDLIEAVDLNDIHLLDTDEEHEVATIVELNKNTLTEAGKKEFENVLNATIISIGNNWEFGTVIYISGARISDLEYFQYMLAGYTDIGEYERCVNES